MILACIQVSKCGKKIISPKGLILLLYFMLLKRLLLPIILIIGTSIYSQSFKVVDNKGTLRNIEQEIGNLAELYVSVAASPQILTENFSDIIFNSTGIVDNSDFSVGGSTIAINKTGRYEITYRVSTKSKNNDRSGAEFYLDMAGTEVPGTRAYTYSRNSVVDKNTVTVIKIVLATQVSVIKVKGRVYASNASDKKVFMADNGCSLIVKRIK